MKIYAFAAALSLAALFIQSTPVAAQDPLWVRDNTWYFDNFTQAELGWDIFRETYIGVAPTPSGDFDLLFYNSIFKTELAAKGHCHGMCAMALMIAKNGGHLGYCHPPYVYSGDFTSPSPDTVGPTDRTLKRAIQMMHGSQISHTYLSFLLDVIALGKNRDGRYAAQQLDYYNAKNDPCLISLTKGLLPTDGAHTLIGIHTKPVGSKIRIYVYDPNWSYYNPSYQSKYDMGNDYVEIDPSSGAWNASNTSVSTYSGSPSSGGSCVIVPISIAGRKDRLPQSFLAEGAYAINTIFIFGENAHVVQVSDPLSNRRYLNENGSDVETNDAYRLPNIMPFQPQNGGQPTDNSVQTYFVRGDNPTLDIQIRAKGKYRVGMLFGGKYTEKEAEGDGISVQCFRTTEQSKPQ